MAMQSIAGPGGGWIYTRQSGCRRICTENAVRILRTGFSGFLQYNKVQHYIISAGLAMNSGKA